MTFVFSFWYIVIAVLVLGIAGCVTGFILMDKKDRIIIKEFVDSSSEPQAEQATTAEKSAE